MPTTMQGLVDENTAPVQDADGFTYNMESGEYYLLAVSYLTIRKGEAGLPRWVAATPDTFAVICGVNLGHGIAAFVHGIPDEYRTPEAYAVMLQDTAHVAAFRRMLWWACDPIPQYEPLYVALAASSVEGLPEADARAVALGSMFADWWTDPLAFDRDRANLRQIAAEDGGAQA